MKKLYIFPPLLGSLVLTGRASGQIDAMQIRLNQQEQQIRLLNSQLSGVQPAQADTWAQAQSLRWEMSAVKGQIGDFNNATAAAGGLPGPVQRMNNHEVALQVIATQFGMELPVATVSSALGAAPGIPDATAAAPVPVALVMQPQAAVPAPQQAAPQTQVQGDIAKVLYDGSAQLFNVCNYKQALKSSLDFMDTYGKHKLVSNAWFWRGEYSYQPGDFPAAAPDYEQVISKYGPSRKTASAYLKQRTCFIKVGKKDVVKVRLQELIKKFPKSSKATRATQLMKDNKMQKAS